MATSTSKTDKLVNKLRSGKKLTASQIMHMCGFSSQNSVYGTICRLREEGYKITTKESKTGLNQYTLA